MAYKLSTILDQAKTGGVDQETDDGRWIVARWMQFNDGAWTTRVADAWLVLRGKAEAVEWK